MRLRFVGLLIVIMLITLPLHINSEAQATATMTIKMNDVERTNNMVAGVIHNVTIVLPAISDNVTIKAYLQSGYSISNRTNNYSWSYKAGIWTDDLYTNYYLKNDSASYGLSLCFNIAVDATAIASTWCFITYSNDISIIDKLITIETPWAGISMSAPTFYFRVIPYGTGYISSWKSDDAVNSTYLTTKNIGNVPLILTITFESLNAFGSANSFLSTNTTGTFVPNEERRHFIDFQAQSWSPRKSSVKGYINGDPQLLMTPGTVTTKITPQTTFDIVVTVARPGYEVFQMDGVSVQYKTFYTSAYKQTLSLDMYLTGNKTIFLNHDMTNLTFDHFFNQGERTEDELVFSLTDNTEQQVIVNITCSSQPPWKQPSMLAYANFDLRLADNAGTGRFTSTVVVSATAEVTVNPMTQPSVIVIIILIVVFIVIGILLFRTYKKTEEERRKELEDNIRKKKERARKQRKQ
ncbi:MAG: hypothetical protein Q7J68_03390 [Thermoplasmata archaeon]|nr:hypothetical protein [Thermoplasmata archaeon]